MIKDNELALSRASQLERMAWGILFLSMLTTVSSEQSFPPYNIVLGFWAAFCSFTKNGRATFGYISFTLFSVVLDIVFCILYGGEGKTGSFKFAFAMFVFCMFTKLASLYTSSQLFAAIGGPASMESSFYGHYDFIDERSGSYYPPDNEMGHSSVHSSGRSLEKSTDSIASVNEI